MKLSWKGMAAACGLLWAGALLTVGLANLAWPGYGRAFLDLAASIYPGYSVDGDLGQVIVGTLYGLLDGAIGGALLAWLYNLVAAREGEARAA